MRISHPTKFGLVLSLLAMLSPAAYSQHEASLPAPETRLCCDVKDTLMCIDASNDTLPLEFNVTDSGTHGAVIVKVWHQNQINFTGFSVFDSNGTQIAGTVDSFRAYIPPYHSVLIRDTIILPHDTKTVFSDSLVAYFLDPADGTTKQVAPLVIVSITTIPCSLDVPAEQHNTLRPSASLSLIDSKLMRILIPEDWSGPVHVEIVNILGAKLLEHALEGNTMDVTQLRDGVYFYRVSSQTKSNTGQILIGR